VVALTCCCCFDSGDIRASFIFSAGTTDFVALPVLTIWFCDTQTKADGAVSYAWQKSGFLVWSTEVHDWRNSDPVPATKPPYHASISLWILGNFLEM
jgi:hypothetical protein